MYNLLDELCTHRVIQMVNKVGVGRSARHANHLARGCDWRACRLGPDNRGFVSVSIPSNARNPQKFRAYNNFELLWQK